MIKKQDVANKLIDYLYYRVSLTELVHWAEQAMMEEEFDELDLPLLREIIARLGLSDTMAFGLSLEHCRKYLNSLGYDVEINVKKAASNQ